MVTDPSKPFKQIGELAATVAQQENRTSLARQLARNLSRCGIKVYELASGKGRVVLATQAWGGSSKAGFAFCSPRDEFDLLTGITIAVGRLGKNKSAIIFQNLAGDGQGSEPVRALNAISNAGKLPTWAPMPQASPTITSRMDETAP